MEGVEGVHQLYGERSESAGPDCAGVSHVEPPPTLIRPDVEVTTKLTVKSEVIEASLPFGYNVWTSMRIDTDRGGPFFTNDKQPVRIDVKPPKSASVEQTVPWKVPKGYKSLRVHMRTQWGGGATTRSTYLYEWQDNPKPTATVPGGGGTTPTAPTAATPVKWPVTADGYPDISGDWIEAVNHWVKIVQGLGGKVTATCTYKLGARTIRWTMTGASTEAGGSSANSSTPRG